MNCENYLLCALSILTIGYIIYFLSNIKSNCPINKSFENYENYENYVNNVDDIDNINNEDDVNNVDDIDNIDNIDDVDNVNNVNNEDDVNEYYMRPKQKLCKTNKKWHDKFYNKDKYYNKVDKINQLINEMDPFIEHDTSVNIYTGKKISDIYDELTKNDAKCYSKKCLKKPFIDPYTGNTYYFSDNTNKTTITNSQWEYDNECTMNGGAFDGNVYGFYPDDNNNISLAI